MHLIKISYNFPAVVVLETIFLAPTFKPFTILIFDPATCFSSREK